jgi:2-dehydro-3-deoxyphosphooctonate aldolase (KDO 8-P synthase)
MKPGVSKVKVGGFEVGGEKLTLIGGPCVIEDLDTCLEVAGHLKAVTDELGLNFIFKSSFEKDNRSSASGFKGPGLEDGLRMLAEVKSRFNVPVLSDVHCREQVEAAAEVLDVIQIPAYLSQQTELALAAGKSGRVVNVKKGQFVAPEDMKAVVSKIRSTGNTGIILTERGSCFGYRRLVVDMRAMPIMRSLDCPVIFDATHAVRIYGHPSSEPAGGEPQYIPCLARAAVACGADGLFLETHPEPKRAMCDSSSMLPLSRTHWLLSQVAAIDRLVRTFTKE